MSVLLPVRDGAPHVSASLESPSGVVLGAVAGVEARARIRESVAAQDRRERIDFAGVA